MADSFVFEDNVHIYDTDAQGIVHYAGYYRFFTDATEDFMHETLGINFPLIEKDIWLVVVESEAHYHKPAMLGDMLSVMLNPEIVSDKVLKFNFEILRSGDRICDGHITQISINKNEWKAVPIPEQILDKMKRIL